MSCRLPISIVHLLGGDFMPHIGLPSCLIDRSKHLDCCHVASGGRFETVNDKKSFCVSTIIRKVHLGHARFGNLLFLIFMSHVDDDAKRIDSRLDLQVDNVLAAKLLLVLLPYLLKFCCVDIDVKHLVGRYRVRFQCH